MIQFPRCRTKRATPELTTMNLIASTSARAAAFAIAVACAVAAHAQTYDYTLTAMPTTVTVQPGSTVTTWTFNGSMPGPVIRGTAGQPLRIRYVNQTTDPSIVHFHGLEVPVGMDGVIGLSRPAVAPGEEFIYEITPPDAGTYWYHPHVEDQMDLGLYGVMIVDPANPADDPPFNQEQTIILDDSINLGLGVSKPGLGTFSGYFINGKTSTGQTPIAVQNGQTLRLRILNASSRSSYVVALDGHPLLVTHADGHRITPISFDALPIGPGERWDAYVTLNNPGTWSLAVAPLANRNTVLVRTAIQYAGQSGAMPSASYVPPNLSTGTILTYAALSSLNPVTPISATPQHTFPAALGMMMVGSTMMFTINGQVFPNVTPMVVSAGDISQIDFVNTMSSMGASVAHPMHMHGHTFRMMGTAGGTTNPPLKDTVLVRSINQSPNAVSVQFTANNPGRWLMHCHDSLHMMMGMVTLLDYTGDADGDTIPNPVDMDPLSAYPTLTVPDVASAFQIGGSGAISVTWVPWSNVDFFIGDELATPVSFGNYGLLRIWPLAYVTSASTGGSGVANVPYVLPNDPLLVGARVGLQAAATTSLAPGYRASTWQPFTIR